MKTKLSLSTLDTSGKKLGKIKLSKEIFGAKINKQLTAQAVRVYLFNQRQGNASTKTRGQVRGSGRKIWRQKGTGRARHGHRYAPIFVGGGVAHGPTTKDWSLKLSKKMRRKALLSVLSNKYKDDFIVVVEGLEKVKPKTKELLKILLKINPKNKKKLSKEKSVVKQKSKLEEKVLLVISSNKENIMRAGRNIKNLKLIQANLLNTYEVLNHKNIIFTKEAMAILEKTFKN